MATPIGTNVVTSIARHYIMPDIMDNIYKSNVLFYRMNAANKRIVRGGTQIEIPLMYARFANGGPYQGFDLLDTSPSDTVKNAAFDWKQQYVNVTVDGLTLIKTDSPDAIANFIQMYFAQAEMEMAENLATGLWSDVVSNGKQIDGIKGAVDDGTVAATYGGILRSANTWWKSQIDTSVSIGTDFSKLQGLFGLTSEGGRHISLIVSRQDQYNKYWGLNMGSGAGAPFQYAVPVSGGRDEQLASAGFTNLLFNGVPWVVDSHVPDAGNASTGRIYFLNEDYMWWVVSPRADFYLEPFQTPVNQDAMVSKMLWAGDLCLGNVARHGVFSSLTS